MRRATTTRVFPIFATATAGVPHFRRRGRLCHAAGGHSPGSPSGPPAATAGAPAAVRRAALPRRPVGPRGPGAARLPSRAASAAKPTEVGAPPVSDPRLTNGPAASTAGPVFRMPAAPTPMLPEIKDFSSLLAANALRGAWVLGLKKASSGLASGLDIATMVKRWRPIGVDGGRRARVARDGGRARRPVRRPGSDLRNARRSLRLSTDGPGAAEVGRAAASRRPSRRGGSHAKGAGRCMKCR